jgi:FkbM family methyltransferase
VTRGTWVPTGPVPVPPPELYSTPLSRWVHRQAAAHADRAAVRCCRRLAEVATALLHSENHDPRTNGEFELVRRMAPFVSVAVDVGANRGDWAVTTAHCAPAARVLCFELASPTRQRLRERVAHLPQVAVLDGGLGDVDGQVTVKYYPSEDRWTSRFDYPHPQPGLALIERIRRGDEVLTELGVDYVDVLKVDAEGSDFAVLSGCAGLLRRGAVGVIQFEYGYACVLARVFLLDFYELLTAHGYVLGRLGPDGLRPAAYRLEMENFFGPNFVAVHESRPDLLAVLTRRTPPGACRTVGRGEGHGRR